MCGLSSKVDIFSRGIAYVRMGQKLTSRASINSSALCHKQTINLPKSAAGRSLHDVQKNSKI